MPEHSVHASRRCVPDDRGRFCRGASEPTGGADRRHVVLTAAAVVALAVAASAQAPGRMLSVDAIYHPDRRVDFGDGPPAGVTWIDSNSYLTSTRGEWTVVDAVSGRGSSLFDAGRLQDALARLPGLTREEARLAARSRDLTLNPTRTGALVPVADDLYFYEFASGKLGRLTTTQAAEEEAAFSPDGRFVSFVRGNDLFVVEVEGARERRLTSDGSTEILNGKLDWLYQEEIYGRGRFRAFWWSPDSSKLAFLQLDERPVPEYTVIDHLPYRPGLEVTDYPKAGDPNPIVRLGVARIDEGAPGWVDLGSYAGVDLLIVNVDWTPDSREVAFQVQDREQTWLDLNLAETETLRARKVLRETTKAWVNENGNPVWLKDGSFLWFSERTGFRHLFHYQADGTLVRPVTSGRWDVRTLYGVDEGRAALYFAATERNPLGVDIYRAALDGSALTRLSERPGTHRATFNPTFDRYVDVWSDVNTPPQARLHGGDGREIRVIDANPVRALSDYRMARPEFVQVKARDGFTMDAMMIKPPEFDPSRRYPVYQFTYAGPGAAQVRDSWGGTQYMFHQLLAQHGIIVWVLDNRSASGKGVESQWPVYGRLGEVELEDLEDGIAWLRRQPYVDASRILLSGWSYGGFMAAYALTHSTSWAAGIVGAPVTDWRNYDTVYTERYMKTPQNNPDGYRRTAPRFAADKLHGRMLLVHGTMDDNVHMQNTLQFAYELQRAGKPFELMMYPRSRHGVSDPRLITHLRQAMLDFTLRTLGVPAAVNGSR